MEIDCDVWNVARPVFSVSHANDRQKAVWFTSMGSGVCASKDFHFYVTGDFLPLHRKARVCELDAEVTPAPKPPDMMASIEEEDTESVPEQEQPEKGEDRRW